MNREELRLERLDEPRKGWPEGPWKHEPDLVRWRDGDFVLVVLRTRLGSLCGYVGVPERHPWHGLDYDAVPVDAPGGLTFAAEGDEHRAPPSTEEPLTEAEEAQAMLVGSRSWWYLGFDCAHSFDYVPGLGIGNRDDYREVGYVVTEVTKILDAAKLADRVGRGR